MGVAVLQTVREHALVLLLHVNASMLFILHQPTWHDKAGTFHEGMLALPIAAFISQCLVLACTLSACLSIVHDCSGNQS